ncbi:hypothetical protein [Actinomycetospora flava]|uniref:Bulb-type lectin domain-containing protein n=1 Tax=Actinomycetospora flava TaxID=3129232 RepID=A0ABU8M8F4_9PSEU
MTTTAPLTASLSSLTPGTPITSEVRYRTDDGRHHLLFQKDGNLVVSDAAGADIWGLHQVFRGFDGRSDARCVRGRSAEFGSAGALTVRDDAGAVVWTTPPGGARLSMDGRGRLALAAGDGTTVWAANGWCTVRTVDGTGITVMASRDVTPARIDAVVRICREMVTRITTRDRSAMQGAAVYVVNGEPWVELGALSPINGKGLDGEESEKGKFVGEGETLRGGACTQFCWVDEKLMCATGSDGEARTFDQVVHELAHVVLNRYQLSGASRQANPDDPNPRCGFAWAVQHWFGCPDAVLAGPMRDLVSGVFSSRVTFTCPDATPVVPG